MRVRRVPAVDELQRGDERLVLVRDRAVRLAGLAPAILDLTEGWREVDDLTAELEIRFGTPLVGGADKVVRIAVSDLAAVGLIEVREP